MQFITLLLLGVLNLAALYIYFSSLWTMEQINQYLWSWFEISFEPSEYTSVAVVLFLAVELLLIVLVYFYGAYNRRLTAKVQKFKAKNKDLSTEQSAAQKMLSAQEKKLKEASTLEAQNEVLRQSLNETHAHLEERERHITELEHTLANLERGNRANDRAAKRAEQWQKLTGTVKGWFKK